MEEKQTTQLPILSIEGLVNEKVMKFSWNKEGVIRLVYECLAQKGLLANKNNRIQSKIPVEDIEKIANTVIEQIFNPQAIEEIIYHLIDTLINVAVDVKNKNPEIILMK